MSELERARSEIDRIDGEMLTLFRKRMQVCAGIADDKKKRGLPVYDPAREAAMLDERRRELADPALEPYYTEFLRAVIALSRRYQTDRMGVKEGET